MLGKNHIAIRPTDLQNRRVSVGFVTIVIAVAVFALPCLAQSPSPATRSNPNVSARPTTAKKDTAKSASAKNEYVAVVNGQRITRDELAKECTRRFGKEVLQSEVNKRLILTECKQQGIQITKSDVEAEVARVAAQFRLPLDRWYAMLRDERGIDQAQYKRDIIWPTLALRRLAANDLQVSQADLKKAFEAEFGPKVQVRMIATASLQKAQQLRRQAAANPDVFDRLAKDESEDENSAAARGLVPPIRMHSGSPEIERTAFALKEGQVSQVIKFAGQHVILKCERQIPAIELTPEQRKEVVQDLRNKTRDEKLREAGSEMFKRLQAKAKVVNVFNDAALRKQMPGVAATVNGSQITMAHLGEQCVVRHGAEVLQSEINRRLLTQALKRRSLQVTKSELNAEVARAAESFGHIDAEGNPDVDSWLKHVTEDGKVTVDLYVRDAVWPSVALKKLVNAQVKVTEEDIQKGFVANYGERVEVLAIVMSSQRTAYEVFKLARDNSTEKFFGELAHQYSVEAISRANYGQVPPIRRHGGQPLIEEEAFKLKPGEISGVLAAGDKYIILRCIGRTKPIVADISAVRNELHRDIHEKKVRIAMNQEFNRLQDSAQIDNFLLAKSQIPKKARPASQTLPVVTGQPSRTATRPVAAGPQPRQR